MVLIRSLVHALIVIGVWLLLDSFVAPLIGVQPKGAYLEMLAAMMVVLPWTAREDA